MNFKKLLLFVAAPLMLVLAGCQPEPVAPSYAACEVVDAEGNALTSLSFTAEAGSQTFNIKATRSWTITTTADWYGVTPSSMTNTDNTEKSTVVTVTAFANDGEARSSSLTITCGDLDPINITVSQADAEGNTTGGSGDGTEASPYSVARALEIINGGQYTTDMVYTAGTISNIKEVDPSYGNATFNISDDGTTTSGQLTIYRCKYLNNTKFTSTDQIKVGDKVVVLGALTLYNTTPEVTQGGYLVKINDLEGTPAPELKEGPYTSDEAFVCKVDNNNAYTLNGLKIGSEDVSGFKLGKSKGEGFFTSGAVGVSGDKYLNFYAAAWKGSTVTLYFRVDGGAVQSQALTANDSISNDLAAMSFAATDHYSIKLTGLTATSKIEFSTNNTFTAKTEGYENGGAPRAVVCGVKLSDSPIEGVDGGGGSTEPEPTPGEKTYITLAEALATTGNFASNAYVKVKVISNSELNNLTSNKNAHIQDETAGIGLRFTANHTYKFGDELEIKVGGLAVSEYNGAKQLNNVPNANVTVLSQNNTITPKTVAMADFLANKYENQYIALENVQVVDADLTKTWTVTTAQNHTSINMTDANGNTFIVFTSKYSTALEKTVAQGSGTIKGIATTNTDKEGVTHRQIVFAQESDYAGLTGTRFTVGQGGTTEPDPTPDPEPTPDPTPGEESTITIPELYALADGALATEQVINVVVSGASQNCSFGTVYVMTPGSTAAKNGFSLYNSALEGKYKVGDMLKITLPAGTAKKETYKGMPQLSGITDANIVVVSSGNTVNNIVVTADKLLDYLGMPVTIENATVDAAGVWCTASSHGSHNFTAGGTAFTVYVNKRATNFQDVAYSAATGNISGIAVTYNNNLQIAPRDAADVQAFASTGGGTTEPDPTPDPTPGEGDTTDGTTISQDIFANTGALDGKTITWDFDEFTVSTNQHNSSTAIRTTDTDHFRAYQGSLLTFTAKGGKKFSKIVVTCTGSSYATELVNSFGASVATANGAEVTITCDSAEVSAEMVKQVRFKKVAVTLN